MTAVRAGADELARAAKAPLGLLLLLGSLTALGPLSIDMYLPGLPTLARSLRAPASAAQQTVAIFLIGLSLGQLVYGPLSDRYGRRRPILIGLALYVAGSLGCAVAPSIQVLLAFRLMQALGVCGASVIARAVVRDKFKSSEMLHVFSMLMLVLGLSPIFAPLLGGWVLLVGGWRVIFWTQAAAGATLAAAVFFALAESRSEETAVRARAENPLSSYVALLGRRRLWGYVLGGGFSSAALLTYVSSSPDILINQHHIGPQLFGWVFGVNGLGLISATQVNARIARRWPGDLILRWAVAITLGFSLVLAVDAFTGFGGLWGLLIPLFLLVSSLGFTQANTSTEAMKIDPHRAGATAALSGSTSFGVGSACAAVAGAMADGTARPMAMVIAGALLVALLSLQALAPRRRGTAAAA